MEIDDVEVTVTCSFEGGVTCASLEGSITNSSRQTSTNVEPLSDEDMNNDNEQNIGLDIENDQSQANITKDAIIHAIFQTLDLVSKMNASLNDFDDLLAMAKTFYYKGSQLDPDHADVEADWDGFQPFGLKSRSTGAMEVTIATMSKANRCKDVETYTVGFVPSYLLPDSRPNSLDPFLDPLISDLEKGFIEGKKQVAVGIVPIIFFNKSSESALSVYPIAIANCKEKRDNLVQLLQNLNRQKEKIKKHGLSVDGITYQISFTVTLDYKALLLLLKKKDDEKFQLGGKGYGTEFCAFCDAIRVFKDWVDIALTLRDKVFPDDQEQEIDIHDLKLEWFRGKPERASDLSVEEWIDDARAACASRGLASKEQAAYLVEHLAGSQHQRLQEVISDYRTTFSKDEDDIGFCDLVEHQIVTNDERPIKIPHRRVPPQQWTEVRDYIQKSLERGIIRESSSPYASPIVLVRKTDGKLRLCVDYRLLNAKTHKDAYPLPRIDEALDVLKGAKYFCSLDLAHGFNQLPMRESDIEKTAFRTGTGGLYEYTRMPFGLCNAPSTFMRLMDKAFGDLNFQSLLVYLDDILVFGSTFEETLSRLEMVLSRLFKLNLKVKPEKCQLFREKVRYLGHIVTSEGTSPDPEKVRAVMEWSRPETLRELRGFLGLSGYYRRFLPKYAEIANPLQCLLRGQESTGRKGRKKPVVDVEGSVKEKWDSTCEDAFNKLKQMLTTAPVLGFPDFTRKFILETDASFHGLGAVLSQEQEHGLVVLSYASRGLRPSERNMQNYSSMKLELLALYWAVAQKYRDLLIGSDFVVYTDNNPLSYLQTTTKLGATEMRWAADLTQFNFTIKYRSGRSNGNADALSRNTSHGEEPISARLEEVTSGRGQVQSREVGTLVPPCITVFVEELTAEPLVQESRVRSQSVAPKATSTFPSIPKEDLANMQLGDEALGRLWHYWKLKHPPTLRQLMKEPKLARRLLRD
ncbi:hypothetical protein QZH41_003310 [Actinostola sp. cb2023]|nr:hypothetical protein QZH41_003310 [Actinostola sp. cb2023]